MSVITKDLGVATAYGYAKSKGYTGTEEEFAELMASYADVAQQAEAAAQDAEDAKDEAVTAKTDAQTAKTAAQAAQSAAETASGAASTKASEVAQSAQTAAGSATAAGNSATAAAGSATTAQTAAQTATTKASEASSSASAASTAKTGAETARTGAQTAQAAAETAQENAEAAAASVSASAAQIEQNTADIGAIKNDLNQFPNGNYPQMGAGYANQLVSGLKKEDSTPYNFRKVPYDATLEEVKKIVGVTVVNNQLVVIPDSVTKSGITFTNNNNGSITINGTASNTVYEKFSDTVSSITNHVYYLEKGADGSFALYNDNAGLDTGIAGRSSVGKATADKSFYYYIASGTTIDNVTAFPQISDLTQMFGTTIADYVYSLETATAGAGVAWLKKHFPAQFDSGYQAYDAGTLKSIEGLSGKKTVGFNQWDEQWEVGSIGNNGEDVVYNNVRTKGYNLALPSTTYYVHSPNAVVIFWYDANKTFISSVNSVRDITITSPSNASYFRFRTSDGYGTTYNHDICINFSDPTKNGTYKPYEAHSYALDSDVVLRGIPKLDSNNRLYYDGDEYLPDGTINRRYGVVDLGTLTYGTLSSGVYYVNLSSQGYVMRGGAVCENYPVVSTVYTDAGDKVITTNPTGVGNAPYIVLKDSSYSDSLAFKTAMSGVYLLYELAAPTTETADPYTTPQIIAPDGTEEYIYEDSAFELPVGHSSDYPVDVSGQLDDILDTPSANGTYTLKATVADGAVTYSWVADA